MFTRALSVFAASLLSLSEAVAADPPFAAHGSTRILWKQVFASPRTDWINDVIQLRDGNLLAVGYLGRDDRDAAASDWQALAVKLSPDGREIWRRLIDNPGKLDAFWSAVERPDGVIAVSGMTDGFGKGGDAFLAWLNPDGSIRAQAGFGGAGDERATDLALSPDGGAVLFGQTNSEGAGERDFLVVRTDAQGREIWRKTFGGAGIDRGFYGAAVDGGYVVAGVTGVEDDLDVMIIRIDSQGREVWRRVVGEKDLHDTQHGLALLSGGRILVTGYTQSWGAEDRDMMSIVLSPNGDVLSRQAFGGPGDDRVMSVHANPEGGAWAAGYSRSAGAGEWDAFAARIGDDGRFTGEVELFGTAAADNGTTVMQSASGRLVLGGYSASLGDGGVNGFVLEFAPGGARPSVFTAKIKTAAGSAPG